VAHHEFHGSSSSPNIPYYFYNRNRFLYVAKHAPEALPQVVTTSHFFNNRQYDQLFDCIPFMIKKLVMHHHTETVRKVLSGLCAVLEPIYGIDAIDRILARMQVMLGHRKMSIGIYGPTLHPRSDGQGHIYPLVSALHDHFDLTYIRCQEDDLHKCETRHDPELSRDPWKIISLPPCLHQDATPVDLHSMQQETVHRCKAISKESSNYDLFINTDMSREIVPRSPLSMALCYFLDDLRVLPSSVQGYTFIVAESKQVIERLQGGADPSRPYLLLPTMAGQAPSAAMENVSPPSTDEVCQQTPQLMPAHGGGESLQEEGSQRRQSSTRARFEGQLRSLLATLRREYATMHRPDPQDVARIAFNVRIIADPRIV
jgi:hypothetical protein